MTLYSLRTALDDYRITKFDADLNVESSYIISASPPHECECPAGVRPTCRHRQMLPDLLPLVDTEYLWDFDRRLAVDANGNVQPIAEPLLGVAVADGTPANKEHMVKIPNQYRNWRRI